MADYTESHIKTVSVPPVTEDLAIAAWSDPDYVILFEGPATYTDYTAEAIEDTADDVVLLPHPVSYQDALYVGADDKFNMIKVLVTTAAVNALTLFPQYWNGASWQYCGPYVTENINSWETADYVYLVWNMASAWAKTTIDGNNAFWIRFFCAGGASTSAGLAQRIWVTPTSVAHVGTPSDTLTLTDALVEDASIPLADSINLADALGETASIPFADGISLADVLAEAASIPLSDSISLADVMSGVSSLALSDGISLADVLTEVGSVVLSDGVSLTDALLLEAINLLSDSLSLSDTVIAGAMTTLSDTLSLSEAIAFGSQLILSDSIALSDILQEGGIETVADTVALTDAILSSAAVVLSDILSLSDSLTGFLGTGITTPGTADWAYETIAGGSRQPRTWRKTVTNEPSPVSALTQSSTNTTFSQTGVEDDNYWDLTEVVLGDVAITGDGYLGLVLSTSGNSIVVDAWSKAGVQRIKGATDRPSDEESVTIHRVVRLEEVNLRSSSDNTNYMYMGFDPYITPVTAHPISHISGAVNSEVPVRAPRDMWLNLSRVWVVAGSNQTLIVSGGALPTKFGTGEGAGTYTRSDSITLVDSLSEIAASMVLEDNITLSDNCYSSHIILSDSINLADELQTGLADRSDTITLSDNVSASASLQLADTITLSHNVGGDLSGFPPTPGAGLDAVKVGNYLYITIQHISYGSGVLVMDVSNPAAPFRVAYLLQVPAGYGYPVKIIADPLGRDYVYMGSHYPHMPSNATLVSIDISSPTAPTIAHERELAGKLNYSFDIASYSGAARIYCCLAADGLNVINISDPTAMSVVGSANWTGTKGFVDTHAPDPPIPPPPPPPIWNAHHSFDQPYGADRHIYTWSCSDKIAVNANYIVTTDGQRLYRHDRGDNPGLVPGATLDIDCYTLSPNGLGIVNSFCLSGNIVHVHVSGTSPNPSYGYINATIGTNVDPPTSRCAMSNSYPTNNAFWKSMLHAAHFYNIASGARLRIIEQYTPVQVYAFSDYSRGFYVEGNYLYFLHYSAGNHHLDIYDISTPASPSLVGTGSYI